MNDSIKRLSLDIHSANVGETVNAKKGDTGRKLLISLVDGGMPYTIGEDCHAVFTAKKPDGKVVYNDCTIEKNIIIYEITAQTVSAEGRVNCEIELYGGDGKLITSPKFTIAVFKKVYSEDDQVDSSNEFSALAKLVADAQGAIQAAGEMEAALVIKSASGYPVALKDAAEHKLLDMKVYGKTTQNGVPTPDTPVNMVSLGGTGTINLFVAGKNILPYPFYQTTLTLNGVTFTDNKDGTVSASGTTTGSSSFWFTGYNFKLKKGVTYTLSIGNEITATGGPYVYVNSQSKGIISRINITTQKSVTFTPTEDISDAGIYVLAGSTGMTFTGRIKPQIEVGTEVTPFEKYNAQKIILAIPNGLHGISVLANGNYADGDGQQWIGNVIDFDRGVIIERCRDIVLDGTSSITVGKHANGQCFCAYAAPGIANTDMNNSKIVLSDRYKGTAWSNENNHVYAIGGSMVITDSRFTDKDTTIAILKAELPKFRYVLSVPVETKLTDGTIAAYKELRTYRKDTTIYNDGWAQMKVEYAGDMQEYIYSMLHQAATGRIASVHLPASAWKGSGSLYSQVVPIAGITENSQVNLTPSVEQLSIFYDKNISFVTENDGGVVTVYVIGQKPTSDYTIQADIVEVIV